MAVKRARNSRPAAILEDDYKAALPALQEFCDRIRTEIGLLLRAEEIALGAPLESRIKTWTSLCDKIDRSKQSITSFDDVKDLVGVRVILLYRPDIERTLDLLRGEFPIEAEEKKGMDEDADAFGYQSVHAILRLSPGLVAASACSAPDGLRAEVQIRTLAQHIWAAASHDLQYKKERGVPKPLRRTIQRVSALLETIDLELERVLEEREDYVADIATNVDQLVLDIDILRKILRDRLPAAHADADERYAKILETLRATGIDDVGALSALIDRRLEDALAFDQQIVSAVQNTGAGLGNARLADLKAERIERGVYFCFEGLVRKMLEFEKTAIRKARAKAKSTGV
jgi:GTP pyrophosphokinase